jgi:hypothetical protein
MKKRSYVRLYILEILFKNIYSLFIQYIKRKTIIDEL